MKLIAEKWIAGAGLHCHGRCIFSDPSNLNRVLFKILRSILNVSALVRRIIYAQ